MKKICVISGGGSGMGLATAKIMGEDHGIILVGRTVKKLEGALQELQALGIEAEIFPGDVSNRASVCEVATHAAQAGTVAAVIHAAGLSPHLGNAEAIFTANAMGTIYINEEFAKIMGPASCIVNVASMSAYFQGEDTLPMNEYKASLTDPEQFKTNMLALLGAMPKEAAPGAAYIFSKNFIIWYSAQCACLHGRKGIRIVSVSPGIIKTPMSDVETSGIPLAMQGALGRLGEAEELARLLAFCASDKAGYLTGTDILCDGGAMAAMKNSVKKQATVVRAEGVL
jgi:NAD(P)-dependent dehydrogenase (short-subunit alcohol dehydrogenase family)